MPRPITFAGACCLTALALAAPRAPAQEHPWRSLFDGATLQGWVNGNGKPVTPGAWTAAGGELHRAGRGGSIYTERRYRDFEMEFEWRVSPGGNSGVKYRLHRMPNGGWIGPEFQVLDDQGHPDASRGIAGNRKSASLYDVLPAQSGALRPAGEYNQARIVAQGDRIEHWLNGVRVVEADLQSGRWDEALGASKFGKMQDVQRWFAREAGPIMLQDHGDAVWYRNLRIRELPSGRPTWSRSGGT